MKRFLAAIGRIEQKHRVAGLFWIKWCREAYPSRQEPERERFIVADVIRHDERIEATYRRLGWQVLVTSVPAAELPLADTVLTYNAGWHIELQFRDIKDRPLGIRPLLVRSDDQITGLTHLLTLALRLMTLITTTVRRSLRDTGETLVGLIEGQKSRATDRPTARRLLRAFHRQEITLIRIRGPGQHLNHLAPLPPLLSAILRHLGLADNIYTDLAEASAQ
jgi:transposase